MKYITLFISILLGLFTVSTPKLLSAQMSQGTYFKVHFKKWGRIGFDYYEKNYRFTTIFITNNKNVDTIIVKHIDIDRPTVFTYVMNWNNKNVVYKFIGFNQNDTISLDAIDTTLTYSGNDKRMMIFNEMYGVSDMRSSFATPCSIAEYDIRKAEAENEKSDKQKMLTTFINKYKMDSQSIQILNNYIDLRYYYKLLAVSYPKSISPDWKHPDIARFDSADIRNNLLFSIKSTDASFILSDLIQYNAYLNNKVDKTLLENIPLLNSRYYKTDILNGLVFEVLENKIKSLEERRQILASLKDYMLDNTDETINVAKVGNLSKQALNVKLIGYDGKTTSLDLLLKGDQKIIVLDFWASWCAPCIAEIPKLKDVNARLSKTIKFINISSDKESIKWKEGCNKYNVKENSFLLSNIANNELLKFFGVTGYPTFVVITNKGEVLSWSFLRPSEVKFDVNLQRMLEAI
jgi:thiol-disulfide isomerase/thioredoxin